MKTASTPFHQVSGSEAWNSIKEVLEAVPLPLCLLWQDIVCYANPALLRLLGVSDRFLYETSFQRISASAVPPAFSTGSQAGKERVQLRSGTGEIIPTEATATSIVLVGVRLMQVSFTVEPEALPGVSLANAERRLDEDKTARMCRRLQLIVDCAPALIAYIGSDERYQWVNRAFEQLYDMKSSEVLGRHWYEMLASKVGQDYVEQLRPGVEAALGGATLTFTAHHSSFGDRRDMELSYAPDCDEHGHVRGFVLVVTDRTEQRCAREALRANEERFRTLAEALPSIIWTTTPNGEVDYLSERFREITGCKEEEEPIDAWIKAIHPDDLPGTLTRWQASLAEGAVFEKQYRVLQREGTYRWFLARGLPQRAQSGEIVRWVGVSTDIDRQVGAEEAVREREQRYRLLFEDNPLPMWTYDSETLKITSVNDAAMREYGYAQEEFLAMHLTDLRPEEDVPHFRKLMTDLHTRQIDTPVRHKRKDETVFWAEVTGHESSGERERSRLVVAQNVTERVLLHEELQRRAGHDPLTGLPNRTLLADHFTGAMTLARAERRKVGLLAIDFDRFKQINDTFGHQVGDEFLKAGSKLLQAVLGTGDTLARMGGDELAVIVGNVQSAHDLSLFAQRLMDALREPVTVCDIQVRPTISIGIAIYPDDGATLDDLLRRADYGLYEAKRAGRNCYKRSVQSVSYGVEEARYIERSLRTAAQEDRLLLHYQPMFSPGGELMAMEALLRLTDPQLGSLPPGRFIPIAEESGLINELGVWVLREACRQSREWRNNGFERVPVAINVSATQFLRGDLVEQVQRALRDFSMEPYLLELEVTESLLMENTQHARQQLLTLKEIGLRIAIDDFGTGYSSLSYLHALPLDTLKIDRSFVQQIRGSHTNPIVNTIVELGKNLGLSIVAEGVETEEQYKELCRLGCDLLQGFLLATPQPAEAVSAFLTRRVAVSA